MKEFWDHVPFPRKVIVWDIFEPQFPFIFVVIWREKPETRIKRIGLKRHGAPVDFTISLNDSLKEKEDILLT